MTATVLAALAVLLLLVPSGGRTSSGRLIGLAARARQWSAGVARRRRSTAAPAALLGWLDALSAELRAGRPPRVALAHASADSMCPCPRALGAAMLGGDVAAALRQDAGEQRTPLLHQVAACWSVADSTGSGLASALDQVGLSARSDAEVQAEVASVLAGPRATARLLSILPLLGLVLGSSLGASPLEWLVGSPVGVLVLGTGVVLIAAGSWWTSRMVASVQRDLDSGRGP